MLAFVDRGDDDDQPKTRREEEDEEEEEGGLFSSVEWWYPPPPPLVPEDGCAGGGSFSMMLFVYLFPHLSLSRSSSWDVVVLYSMILCGPRFRVSERYYCFECPRDNSLL